MEKAVSFATPNDTTTQLPSRISDVTNEKTRVNGITRSGNEAKVNGIMGNGIADRNPVAAPTVHAPRTQPPPPPPVSQTRGKRPAYSRRSLKPVPIGISTHPTSPAGPDHANANGQQGQGHNRQESAATVTPLLADYHIDENRGRRLGDVEHGQEHGHQMRRTPSGLLWAALGLGGGERNSTRNSKNSLRTRDSRWSWTSSLDLKLFGRTGRDGRSARTTMSGSLEDERASGSVPMGVAI